MPKEQLFWVELRMTPLTSLTMSSDSSIVGGFGVDSFLVVTSGDFVRGSTVYGGSPDKTVECS